MGKIKVIVENIKTKRKNLENIVNKLNKLKDQAKLEDMIPVWPAGYEFNSYEEMAYGKNVSDYKTRFGIILRVTKEKVKEVDEKAVHAYLAKKFKINLEKNIEKKDDGSWKELIFKIKGLESQ